MKAPEDRPEAVVWPRSTLKDGSRSAAKVAFPATNAPATSSADATARMLSLSSAMSRLLHLSVARAGYDRGRGLKDDISYSGGGRHRCLKQAGLVRGTNIARVVLWTAVHTAV